MRWLRCRFHAEFFEDTFREGSDVVAARCTRGLPEGSTLVRSDWDPKTREVILYFRSEGPARVPLNHQWEDLTPKFEGVRNARLYPTAGGEGFK